MMVKLKIGEERHRIPGKGHACMIGDEDERGARPRSLGEVLKSYQSRAEVMGVELLQNAFPYRIAIRSVEENVEFQEVS